MKEVLFNMPMASSKALRLALMQNVEMFGAIKVQQGMLTGVIIDQTSLPA